MINYNNECVLAILNINRKQCKLLALNTNLIVHDKSQIFLACNDFESSRTLSNFKNLLIIIINNTIEKKKQPTMVVNTSRLEIIPNVIKMYKT